MVRKLDGDTSGKHWTYLSYPLGNETPVYGGGDGFRCKQVKSIEHGDSCNTAIWNFSNHLGTHLDFPRHFTATGRTLGDHPLDFFIFNRVECINLEGVSSGEIIGWEHLKSAELSEDIELLLVKTGFCDKRNMPAYWQENPGFSPDLADHLREAFPVLRVMGFDSISLSSFSHRELGREAHRQFLDQHRPILPLEDMDLSMLDSKSLFKQVIVAPLMVLGADAVPCTVMAEVLDEK